MFLPIRTDSPLRSSPYMNWAMIVVNVFMFVAQNLIGSPGPRGTHWWDAMSLSASEPQLLQFITYGFLHAGGMHLAGNMLFLYIFGNNVNDKMGHVGYLAFYLGSIVFAGTFWALWDKSGTVIGASGGTAAVVGAYLVLFPRARITVLVFFLIIGTFEIPSLWFVLAFFLKDIIGLSGGGNVAHSAHIGGTVFGVGVCLMLLAGNLLPRDQYDVVALIKQWNRRRQYRDAVNTGWNPYGAADPVPQSQPRGWVAADPVLATPIDPRQREVLELRAKISEFISGHDLPAAARGYVELKTLDPQQVLSRQAQLDVANQLAQEQRFAQAAEAYETFLRHYPKYEQVEQVELMLGVVLNRFLNQPARAKELLLRALAKLMDANSVQLARTELQKAEAALGDNAAGLSGTPNMGGAT